MNDTDSTAPDHYSSQLRALERTVGEDGEQAETRFLLAYHYLMMAHVGAARRQLQKVLKLQPDDELTTILLGNVSQDH
jgi:cytochrome c-type biogenesis protein CcmH/NrfG